MSHCLIVELSEEPISKSCRVTEDYFYDDEDINYAADYVSSLDDCGYTYQEGVDMFLEDLDGVVEYCKKDNSITITNIKKFFEADFNAFKEQVNKATLEEFMDGMWAYRLQEFLKPRFGTYIYHTGNHSMPINDFIRDYCKEGSKFYIGGIVDYHC